VKHDYTLHAAHYTEEEDTCIGTRATAPMTLAPLSYEEEDTCIGTRATAPMTLAPLLLCNRARW
jgi:hypothetical protein